ncbi:MAG: pyrroline-5-carboxylate reductase [Legionella sp.]|uniref:pyrroline-5-carboxylate reductase n=1 Tax=Legionella sp. TaxID=459 RepID=UPI0039E4523A
MKSISIIGAGHLGSALARGLIKKGLSPKTIRVSNRNHHKLTRLVDELSVVPEASNREAVMHSDVVILAVKPQYIYELCQEIASVVQQKRPLIISLAAVTEIAHLCQWLGIDDLPMIRVMTNTPMEFCRGTSALFANQFVSAADKKIAETLFNNVGSAFWLDKEQLLDPLTVAIGSAPAYVLLFMEAIQKAAISQGVPASVAKQIAFDVTAGTAMLAEHSQRSFTELRAGVTTPQGVTEHSLQQLSVEDFFASFQRVYQAGNERIGQIKKTI